MNEEKLKQILNKIAQADVPPDIALIAEQTTRNFPAALKIRQSQRWLFTPVRLLAAAAVIIFAFALGRWSKPLPPAVSLPALPALEIRYRGSEVEGSNPPKITVYATQSPMRLTVQTGNDSFWQQKAMAAMQSRPYTQSTGNLLNLYKQYLKEKHND